MVPKLILITGLPASGKSTIATTLAKELKLPLLSKDEYKELLFNELGWTDRAWSKKIGQAAYGFMFLHIKKLLATDHSLVVESNFKPEFDTSPFLKLKQEHPFELIQILCKADGAILFDRFKKRAESGLRHPGHVDDQNLHEFETILKNSECRPLGIEGKQFEIDTTDFQKVNLTEILQSI